MYNCIKILCLIIFLIGLIKSELNFKTDNVNPPINPFSKDTIDIVYGSLDTVFETKSNNSSSIKKLAGFINPVLSLARFKDNLFVLVNATGINIFRCNFNWTTMELNKSSCIDHLNNVNGQDIRRSRLVSMAVSKDELFVGRQDGFVFRCPIEDSKGDCQNFLNVGTHSITGMDFDLSTYRVYISTDSNMFISCHVHPIKSCETYEYDSEDNDALTDIRVAAGALWLGTRNVKLIKCATLALEGEVGCIQFDERAQESPDFGQVKRINFKNGTLYVQVGHKVFKCDPDVPESCEYKLSVANDTETILIA